MTNLFSRFVRDESGAVLPGAAAATHGVWARAQHKVTIFAREMGAWLTESKFCRSHPLETGDSVSLRHSLENRCCFGLGGY